MSEQVGQRDTFKPLSQVKGPEYQRLLAERKNFFGERISLNEEVPGALMPIRHGVDGVGVIAHVVYDSAQAQFILNHMVPLRPRERSIFSSFPPSRLLVFGENSDSQFFYRAEEESGLANRLTQSRRNVVNRAYSDKDFVTEDEASSALQSHTLENISPTDHLRLLCMRLIQAQTYIPGVEAKRYSDWSVRVFVPKPIPPDEGHAAVGFFIGADGKTYRTTVIMESVLNAYIEAYSRYGSVEKACQSDEGLRKIIMGAQERQRVIEESKEPRYEASNSDGTRQVYTPVGEHKSQKQGY